MKVVLGLDVMMMMVMMLMKVGMFTDVRDKRNDNNYIDNKSVVLRKL